MKKQCIKVYSDVQPQNDLEYVSPQIYFPYFQEDINGLDKIEEYEPSDIDRARMTHWEYNDSSRHFKEVQGTYNMSAGESVFCKYLAKANEIYILDKFFDGKDMQRLVYECKKYVRSHDYYKEIFIITNQKDELLQQALTELKKFPKTHADISCNSDIINIMHDRFAILNGKIWHFGAKFAGMYGGIHAFSGPWEDQGNSLKYLFGSFFKR